MHSTEDPGIDPAITGRDRFLWVVAIFLFVFGDALTLQTRGPLLRSFEADFGVSESLLGLVSPAGTVGFILTAVLAGFLAGRLDFKRWILIGIGVMGLTLLLMSGAPVFPLFIVFLIGQGTAAGIVRGLDRPLLSHIYPANRGRMFALHALAWAIGAVIGPIYVNYMLRLGDWRFAYVVLGICFVPLVILVARLRLPATIGAEQTFTISESRAILGRPLILGMAIAITFLGAFEGIIYTWLPYFASEFMPLEQANILLTIFLLAYIPGRLLYSWLVDRYQSLYLSLIVSTLSIPPITIMISGDTGYVLYISVIAAGFFWAGLFPLISTFGVEVAPEYSGPITALSAGGTYLGIGLGPLLVGIIAEQTGIMIAMFGALFMALGVLGTLVLTWIAQYRLQ